jgi:hypothetical protein
VRPSCNELWRADAVDDGTLSAADEESFRRHARLCKICGDRVLLDDRIRNLLRGLPNSEPPELGLRRLRVRLLRDGRRLAMHSIRWRRALLAIVTVMGLAGAAFAGVAFSLGHRFRGAPPVPTSLPIPAPSVSSVLFTLPAATQPAVASASWDRSAPLVSLAEPVPPQVESTTRAVPVPSPVVAPSLASDGKTRAAPKDAARTREVGRHTSDESPAYAEAMSLYRAGEYSAAAEAFHRFCLDFPRSTWLDDAMFLNALSLTQSGRVDVGAEVAARHLSRFPVSFHARDASILVARVARDRGDCDTARRVLRPWLGLNEDTKVAAALGRCTR